MTASYNPYKTPVADLTDQSGQNSMGGSIENGISGNYKFSVGDILSEAWAKVKGFKGSCWLAFLFYALAVYPLMFAIEFGMMSMGLLVEAGEMPNGGQILFSIVYQLAITAFTLPLGMGLFMIGLRHSAGAKVAAKDVFAYFPKTVPLFLTMLLSYLLIIVGFVLFILPGIYLMVAYALALPLVLEKNLSPWAALETSRKAVTHQWFRFVGLYLVMMMIVIVATIPLGIGLIWALPMLLVVVGIVYRNIFGLSSL